MQKVNKNESGLVLGAFLQKHYPHLSRKAIKRAIDRRGCRINGRLELFANTPVQSGQQIEFNADRDLPSKPIAILFEDKDIKIINKPPSVVCNNQLGLLVHRLDKETSGVMAIAKTGEMQHLLIDKFRKREVEKEYIALVEGSFPSNPFTRETFLAKKCVYDGQKIWAESDEGHLATTHFSKISEKDGISVVRARPVSGRTHQIRVHLAALGFPVLGDDHYNREKPFAHKAPRVMLHAYTLKILNTNYLAPIPEDFCELIPNCQDICSR